MWRAGWVEDPIDANGRSEVTYLVVVEGTYKFLQLGCSPDEVSTLIRVHGLRAASATCKSPQTIDESVRVCTFNHVKMYAPNSQAGEQHSISLEVLSSMFNEDGAEQIDPGVCEGWLLVSQPSRW